jgi:hypothetical protein
MADAADSKSVGRKAVWVRLPPPAPNTSFKRSLLGKPVVENPKKNRDSRTISRAIGYTRMARSVVPNVPLGSST